jgi:hypothetical protein
MVVHKNRALLFGGVLDVEGAQHAMESHFYSELYAFDMDRRQWYKLQLKKKKGAGGRRKNQKVTRLYALLTVTKPLTLTVVHNVDSCTAWLVVLMLCLVKLWLVRNALVDLWSATVKVRACMHYSYAELNSGRLHRVM